MSKNQQGNKKTFGLTVEVGDNFNSALRKFKKKIDESGKLQDVLSKQFYEKPTTKRKRKKGAAKARWARQLRDQQLPPKLY